VRAARRYRPLCNRKTIGYGSNLRPVVALSGSSCDRKHRIAAKAAGTGDIGNGWHFDPPKEL
jgi:hypothetical protein